MDIIKNEHDCWLPKLGPRLVNLDQERDNFFALSDLGLGVEPPRTKLWKQKKMTLILDIPEQPVDAQEKCELHS